MQRGFCPIPAYRLQSTRNDLHGKRQSNIFYKFMLLAFPHLGISASSALHDKPLRARKVPYSLDITFLRMVL